MSLNPIKPGLRTIHNGSHDVAKASVVVAAGADLTVPDDVADQLQRDGAFKDGPAPKELLDALGSHADPDPVPEPVVEDASAVPGAKRSTRTPK